ncbi:MAG: hypothetical protein F6K23_13985 [Okeania sp. SIO2C9]|uniref:hypothetical protein n=1 Tax=Okeania sp. SIO2C9 TaxID=2607791 RepID=UPI0013C262E5|nr:hypothetical protein [Okeania sp. SIO2C9]
MSLTLASSVENCQLTLEAVWLRSVCHAINSFSKTVPHLEQVLELGNHLSTMVNARSVQLTLDPIEAGSKY